MLLAIWEIRRQWWARRGASGQVGEVGPQADIDLRKGGDEAQHIWLIGRHESSPRSDVELGLLRLLIWAALEFGRVGEVGEPKELKGATQLRRGFARAALVLLNQHLLALEVAQQVDELGVVEAAPVRRERREAADRMVVPGGKANALLDPRQVALHRIAQEHEQARVGCRGGEQRRHPRRAEVDRRPLAGLLGLSAREELVVARHVLRLEPSGVEAIEEVQLLANLGSRHLRMLPDQLEPARRAGALHADTDEVRWARAPGAGARRGRRRLSDSVPIALLGERRASVTPA